MGFSTVDVVGAATPFAFLGMAVLLLALAAWLVLAAIVALKGDDVANSNRVTQLYGYTVCLVAIIVGLTTVSSILDAAFDRANPLQSEYGFGAALTSFEAYRATYAREQMMFDRSGAARPDTLPEAALRQRYDALVTDRIATVRYRTAKTFTTSGLLFLIALGLFWAHWRWVRRLSRAAAAAV